MDVKRVLCMNGGDGEASYANNSILQRKVMHSARHIVEKAMTETYKAFLPKFLSVADLGSASGPNAFLVVSELMSVIEKTCDDLEHETPSLMMFLNDLPSNDFNSVFKSLPEFYQQGLGRGAGKCFVACMPGSFYGRLFPCNSLHFVHSSYALMWLSQVPYGLISENGESLNKGNICITRTSSLVVKQAYTRQFEKDFSTFLEARSEEIIPGGGMVVTLIGSGKTNAPFGVYEIIGQALLDMVNQGLIEESKLDTFNVPIHAPRVEQVSEIIRKQGSFNVRRLQVLQMDWDAELHKDEKLEKYARGEFVAKYMRAVAEPLLAAAFGEAVMDDLFRRVAKKFANRMEAEVCQFHNIVISLQNKMT